MFQEEAFGANRLSGIANRNRLLAAGQEANYDDDAESDAGAFAANRPVVDPENRLGYRYEGIDAAMNLESDGEGGQQFNSNWMRNNWNIGTSVGGIGRFSNGGSDYVRDGGEGIPLFQQMMDAENGRPIRPQEDPAPQAPAAGGGGRARKRGFFKKLWSLMRGRGWR